MKKILFALLFLTFTFQVSAEGLGDSNQLFAWAEKTYPTIFSPSGGETLTADTFFYRYYSGTGTYFGTLGNDVYIFGPIVGNTLTRLGVISDFISLTEPAYEYNEDEGAVRLLSAEAVNGYTGVQQMLTEKIDTGDELSFGNIFDLYVSELFQESTPVDSIPSYAPRGKLKDFTVDVVSGKIDYSGFVLKGDINLDSKVDFTDLDALKMAFFARDHTSIHDLNQDGSVDLRDMIFLLARIGTEVMYFDFYTTDGEKLTDLSIREYSDSKSFNYIGSETKVMVIPKDINKASGFTEGLSDIDDAWYKKTGWVYENDWSEDSGATGSRNHYDDVKRGSDGDAVGTGKGRIIKSIMDELINFNEVTSNPYLVGWHINVRYVDAGTYKVLDDYGMDGSVSFIQPYEDRIRNPYFAKTTMFNDVRSVTKIVYALQLGAETPTNNIKEVHRPIKASLTRAGEKVIVRQIIHASSITFTSKEERTLAADIWGANNLEGRVNLYRIGPYPHEKDFGSAELKNGSFSAPNLPYGAYKIDFENSCGCVTPMEESFLFLDEGVNIFEFEEKSKNITVGLTIVDGAGEPLKRASVSMKSADCVSEEKIADAVTGDDGSVTFSDMPTGKYDVYVDGNVAASIVVCDNFNGNIVVSTSKLWKFKVAYTSEYGNGTITAKDIMIDFDAQADPSGTIFYADAPSSCSGALFGCGDFNIFNDNFIKPGSKWISFDSNIVIDRENNIVGQMISAELDMGMNGLVCDGHIPSGFGPDSGATTWTYGNGFSSWTLTLEPCGSDGCE